MKTSGINDDYAGGDCGNGCITLDPVSIKFNALE